MKTPRRENLWWWPYLDADRAAQLWAELGEWVAWLKDEYELDSQALAQCWYAHPPARTELTALMAGYKAAYTGAHDEVYTVELTSFHTQWFWPAVHRLAAAGTLSYFGYCRPGHCDRTDLTLEEFAAADVEARRQSTAAPPPAVVEVGRQTNTDSDADTDNPAPNTTVAAAAVISYPHMQQALAAGLATKAAGSAVEFEDRIWRFDAEAAGYRPETNAPGSDPST